MPLPNVPPGIETRCNAVLTSVMAQLPVVQANQQALHGKNWQGLVTPADTPQNGADSPPNKARKPSDQMEDWSAVTLPNGVPCSVTVDIHQGPTGWGYTLVGEIVIGQILWRRSIGVGPGSTTHDWMEITAVIV